MTKPVCGVVLSGVLLAAGTATAAEIPVSNNAVTDRAAIIDANGLVPLNLTGQSYGGLIGGPNNNSYSTTFTGLGGNFAGSLSIEVFGNVPSPGTSLNDVVLVYTFVGDLASFGAETFRFGLDSAIEIDLPGLAAAQQGQIVADSTVGQLAPSVSLFDNSLDNDTWYFDFFATGDPLGGQVGQETFTWYVRSGGDIALGLADVLVTDFGGVTIQMLAPVNDPNQPDLNVPAPGAVALLLAGAGLGVVRRRR